MICYTAFADGAFVQTGFQPGATVRRRDLYAAPGGTSPEEAVAEHRRAVAEFSTRHGQPLPNRSMADLLCATTLTAASTAASRSAGASTRFVALTALVTLAAAIQLVRIVAPRP